MQSHVVGRFHDNARGLVFLINLYIKNGQTETSYTSEGPVGLIGSSKRKSMQKLVKGKSTEEQKCQHAKKVSPSPSISGSSLKSTDEMCQEEEIEKVLFQIKCYDSNRNTSQLVVGVC